MNLMYIYIDYFRFHPSFHYITFLVDCTHNRYISTEDADNHNLAPSK